MAIVLEQEATNTQSTSETATTIAATLGAGATAGNLLVTACSTDKDSGAWTPPSGFTIIPDAYNNIDVSLAMAYKVAAGGETTITWTSANSEEHNMWVGEYSGLTSSPLDVYQDANSGTSNTATQSSGTTGTTAQADELAVAIFTVDSASIGGTPSYNNGFTQIQQLSDVNSGNSVLWVATKVLSATGTVECTLTITGGSTDQMAGQVATFKAAAAATFAITARAYRIYADGTESGSTALANENTAYDADVTSGDVNMQLRYGVQETGGVSGATTDDYQLQYSKNGGAWTDVAAASTVAKAFPSTNLTDAASTTNRLSAGSGSFGAGELDEADGLVTDWRLLSTNYSELLYSITVISADVADNDTLTFRVMRNGAVLDTYSVTPTITITKSAGGTNSVKFGSGVRAGAVGTGGLRVVTA